MSEVLRCKIWQAFIMLESSRAVKCPSLSYHLAGMKCFQLALSNEQFLEEVFQEKIQFADDFREITEEMFTIDQVEDKRMEFNEDMELSVYHSSAGNDRFQIATSNSNHTGFLLLETKP